MTTELELDPCLSQSIFFVEVCAHFAERHRRAAPRKQLRRCHTAPRRPDDGDPLATNGELQIGHLNFNVVRLNRAKMMARMTNRVMTFGSLHPINSK